MQDAWVQKISKRGSVVLNTASGQEMGDCMRTPPTFWVLNTSKFNICFSLCLAHLTYFLLHKTLEVNIFYQKAVLKFPSCAMCQSSWLLPSWTLLLCHISNHDVLKLSIHLSTLSQKGLCMFFFGLSRFGRVPGCLAHSRFFVIQTELELIPLNFFVYLNAQSFILKPPNAKILVFESPLHLSTSCLFTSFIFQTLIPLLKLTAKWRPVLRIPWAGKTT